MSCSSGQLFEQHGTLVVSNYPAARVTHRSCTHAQFFLNRHPGMYMASLASNAPLVNPGPNEPMGFVEK